MPLNGLRWSRNSGSANCDMPQSAVFGRPGGGTITEQYVLNLHLFCIIHYLHLVETHWLILENFACLLNHAVAQMGADM